MSTLMAINISWVGRTKQSDMFWDNDESDIGKHQILKDSSNPLAIKRLALILTQSEKLYK